MLIIWKCFCLAGLVLLWQQYLHARCVCVCVCYSRTDTTVYRTVLAHPVVLCEIDSIELRNTGARFYRQGDVHVKSVCLSEFPSLRYSSYRTMWTHTLLSPGFYSSSSTVNHLHVRETAARPVTAELPHKEMKYTSSRSETLCYCGSCLQPWQDF